MTIIVSLRFGLSIEMASSLTMLFAVLTSVEPSIAYHFMVVCTEFGLKATEEDVVFVELMFVEHPHVGGIEVAHGAHVVHLLLVLKRSIVHMNCRSVWSTANLLVVMLRLLLVSLLVHHDWCLDLESFQLLFLISTSLLRL